MVGTGTHEAENKSYLIFLSIPNHQISRIEIPDISYAQKVLVGNKRIIIWGLNPETQEATVVSYNKQDGSFKTLLKQQAYELSVNLEDGLTTVTPFIDQRTEGLSQVFEDTAEIPATLTEGLSYYMALANEKT